MIDDTKSNPRSAGIDSGKKNAVKTTYHQFGFRSANHATSKPEAIKGFLDRVYEIFLNEHKLDEEGLKQKIAQLKSDINQKRIKENELNAEIALYKQHKEDKEKEIEELELEKIEIRNGKDTESIDTIPFVIGAFITILLTLYLFIFYSSSGYSAFYGVKPGSLGFINPNVFTDAINKGSGVITLIILFPVIFLGLGFLIHDALEKIKKAQNKMGIIVPLLRIMALLFVTLIADAFIGYKIAQGIYLNEFNAGIHNIPWEFSIIYSDINFYLVLILGFVVYVIWGFLLNFVLSHAYLKTESEKMKLQIEFVSNRIIERQKDLSEILSRLNSSEGQIRNLKNEIEEKENDIISYEGSSVPVSIPLLEASVGEFLGGWQLFTNSNFNEEIASSLIDKALGQQKEWLIAKIENLNNKSK